MSVYRTDAKAITRAHLAALEKYGHDCIVPDTDTAMLAEATGAKSECIGDETGGIVAPAIKSLDEVDRLKVVNPESDGRIPALLEAVELLSGQIGRNVGNVDTHQSNTSHPHHAKPSLHALGFRHILGSSISLWLGGRNQGLWDRVVTTR